MYMTIKEGEEEEVTKNHNQPTISKSKAEKRQFVSFIFKL